MYYLFAAIASRFNASNPLKTLLSGKMYLKDTVPQNITYPYATYGLVTEKPEYYFCGNDEVILIDIHFFSQNSDATELLNLQKACMDLYDDCKLTVSGYLPYLFERGSTHFLRDIEMNTYEMVIEYTAKMEKA